MSMAELPLVTIVTPTFNNADYLSETIESVLSQTYDNIEYVVINDGSTDNTREILEQFKDRCTVIHQENAGQSETLNRGWAKAKGTILGYISSDDRLGPECIAESVKVLESDNSIVATYCDFDLIDSNGNWVRSVITENFDAKRLTEDLVCQPGPGAFFRSDAFNRVGGWNKELRQTPDFEFWLRLQLVGGFKRIPENLADFRIHENSTSFRMVSVSNSDEMVNVVKIFSQRADVNINKKRSLSTAYLISAKSHFQSGRFFIGFKNLTLSIKTEPLKVFTLNFYRFALSGIFRRFYYLVRGMDV